MANDAAETCRFAEGSDRLGMRHSYLMAILFIGIAIVLATVAPAVAQKSTSAIIDRCAQQYNNESKYLTACLSGKISDIREYASRLGYYAIRDECEKLLGKSPENPYGKPLSLDDWLGFGHSYAGYAKYVDEYYEKKETYYQEKILPHDRALRECQGDLARSPNAKEYEEARKYHSGVDSCYQMIFSPEVPSYCARLVGGNLKCTLARRFYAECTCPECGCSDNPPGKWFARQCIPWAGDTTARARNPATDSKRENAFRTGTRGVGAVDGKQTTKKTGVNNLDAHDLGPNFATQQPPPIQRIGVKASQGGAKPSAAGTVTKTYSPTGVQQQSSPTSGGITVTNPNIAK